MEKKILVALSGGVDSATCVSLLKKQGYQVAGVVIKMSEAHEQTVQDAKEAAKQLGIPLYVEDKTEDFKKYVTDYFIAEYCAGRTPNPCIVCNPNVKFKTLVDVADRYGYDKVATGHYAKILKRDGKYLLARGESQKRDQSYMLYRLGQRELKRLVFPLAEMEKDRVRALAEEEELSCAKKPDSQEICFVPDNNYVRFIEENGGKSQPGEFISPEGEVCGTHQGIIHYTIGQRKHLGIALGRPVFVKKIDPEENRVYLADAGQEYYQSAIVDQMTYPSGEERMEAFEAQVKIRSAAPLAKAYITPLEGKRAKVTFETPQRAVAKGQSIVMYDEEGIVIGGGFVREVFE